MLEFETHEIDDRVYYTHQGDSNDSAERLKEDLKRCYHDIISHTYNKTSDYGHLRHEIISTHNTNYFLHTVYDLDERRHNQKLFVNGAKSVSCTKIMCKVEKKHKLEKKRGEEIC